MTRLLSVVGNLVPATLITRLERDFHGQKVIGSHGFAFLCRRRCAFWKLAGCRLPCLSGLSLDLSNGLDSFTRVRARRRGGESAGGRTGVSMAYQHRWYGSSKGGKWCPLYADVVQDESPGAPFSGACASISRSRMTALLRFGCDERRRAACCEARVDVLGHVRVRRFVDEEREASWRRGDEGRELRRGRGVP